MSERVGYKRPPTHSRFKPGQSGNPKGRAKGSQNLRTIFDKIMREQVTVREGGKLRKISKAEAILRSLVLGAMRGDPKNIVTMFRLAEQMGQFADRNESISRVEQILVSWNVQQPNTIEHGD